MKRYPKYKDSEIEWLGNIPEHWEVKKLKFLAIVQPSNVDKKTFDNEIPVLLCNYSDVYKNKWISNELDFMKATATYEEITKFSILKGDVIITKDSENAYDIAVPALVVEDFEKVICGYHLTQIRPKNLDGSFLFYLFQCKRFNGQFIVSANGVTRFGLSSKSINDAYIGFPCLSEQKLIASFINSKIVQIDQFINDKKKLIDLLEEQKTAFINHAVTKGLNLNVVMEPTEVKWLGEIPAHWEVKRAKYYFYEVDERSEAGTEKLLSVSHITGVTPRSEKNITMFQAESYEGYKTCQAGDVVCNIMWAWAGAIGISNHSGIVSSSYGVYRQRNHNNFINTYLDYLLRTNIYIANYNCRSKGIRLSRLRMYTDDFFDLLIIKPPKQEQEEILKYIETECAIINQAISKAQKEIELIQEYRTTLISDAVTGKIDVRHLTPASSVED